MELRATMTVLELTTSLGSMVRDAQIQRLPTSGLAMAPRSPVYFC
jgi:hypothetical protein